MSLVFCIPAPQVLEKAKLLLLNRAPDCGAYPQACRKGLPCIPPGERACHLHFLPLLIGRTPKPLENGSKSVFVVVFLCLIAGQNSFPSMNNFVGAFVLSKLAPLFKCLYFLYVKSQKVRFTRALKVFVSVVSFIRY